MNRKLGLGFWLAGSLLMVGGACDRFAKEERVEQNITVTKADHNKNVRVATGGRVTVRLNWTPGTGYDWVVSQADPTRLQQEGDPTTERGKNPVPGAPETRVFQFKAVNAGGAILEFHSRRPWEKDAPPLDVFLVRVQIVD